MNNGVRKDSSLVEKGEVRPSLWGAKTMKEKPDGRGKPRFKKVPAQVVVTGGNQTVRRESRVDSSKPPGSPSICKCGVRGRRNAQSKLLAKKKNARPEQPISWLNYKRTGRSEKLSPSGFHG